MKAGIEEFGQPIYGLAPAGIPANERAAGVVSQYGGDRVAVLYQLSPVDRLEVATGRHHRLGGTRNLMTQLTTRVIPMKPRLPWQLSLSERDVSLPVDGTPTQFHLVEASTGDWMAAGGFRRRGVRKRYLLLTGTAGVKVEELSLVPVSFDLTGDGGAHRVDTWVREGPADRPIRRLLPDLFHITEEATWESAVTSGVYDQSTRGASREDVGFIHASFAWQVERVANFMYEFISDPLVLLRIDPTVLQSQVRVEAPEDGAEGFPHIYGPIDLSAVVEVLPFERRGDRYELPFSSP